MRKTMLKIKKYFNATLIIFVFLLLQSCSVVSYWFMVTNTAAGNVCIENLQLALTDPYAQQVGKIIYSRYGVEEGEKPLYSNPGRENLACNEITANDAPVPNLIISVEFYKEVIEPEYLGTAPKPATNTTL